MMKNWVFCYYSENCHELSHSDDDNAVSQPDRKDEHSSEEKPCQRDCDIVNDGLTRAEQANEDGIDLPIIRKVGTYLLYLCLENCTLKGVLSFYIFAFGDQLVYLVHLVVKSGNKKTTFNTCTSKPWMRSFYQFCKYHWLIPVKHNLGNSIKTELCEKSTLIYFLI